MSIDHAPEWVTEQYTYFTDWCNDYLQERQLKVRDFKKDFSDGVMIVNLLEIVTGESLGRYNKNPRFPGQKLDNIMVCINFMERKWGKKLHGVMEGDTRSILGLLFVILWAVKRETEGKAEIKEEPTSLAVEPTSSDSPLSTSPEASSERTRRMSRGSIFHTMRSLSGPRSRPPESQSVPKAPHETEVIATANTIEQPAPTIIEAHSSSDVTPSTTTGGTQRVESPQIPRSTAEVEKRGILTPRDLKKSNNNDKVEITEKLDIETQQAEGEVSRDVTPKIAEIAQEAKSKNQSITECGVQQQNMDEQQSQVPTGSSTPTPRLEYESRVGKATTSPDVDYEQDNKSDTANISTDYTTDNDVETDTETETDVETDTETDNSTHLSVASLSETPTIMKTSVGGTKSTKASPVKADDELSSTKKKRSRTFKADSKEGLLVEDKPPATTTPLATTMSGRDTLVKEAHGTKGTKKRVGTHSRGKREKKSLLGVLEGKKSFDEPTSDDDLNDLKHASSPVKGTEPETKEETFNSAPSSPVHVPSSRLKKKITADSLYNEIKVRARSDSKKGRDVRQPRLFHRTPEVVDKEGETSSHSEEPAPTATLHKRTKRQRQSHEKGVPFVFIENEDFIIRLQAMCRACVTRRDFKKVRKQALDVAYADTLATFHDQPEPLLRLQAVIRGVLWRKYPPRFIKDHRTRKAVVEEVVNTEDLYVNSLHYLNTAYQKVLVEVPPEFLDFSKLKPIFSSSQMIYGFNLRLLKELRSRVEKWYTNRCIISDIFLKIVDFMKIYTAYVNHYDEASKVIEHASSHPQVSAALLACRVNPNNTKQLDLMSMLIMPIQRLPRYVLLIKELLAHTPEDHPDFAQLEILLSKLSTVTAYINQKKREMENYRAVSAIAEKLQGYDQENFGALIKPSRMFIKQGPLGLFDFDPSDVANIEMQLKNIDSLRNFNTRYVFLFTDMILATKTELTDKSLFERKFGAATIQDSGTAYTLEELRSSDISFRFAGGLDLQSCELQDIVTHPDLPIFALRKVAKDPSESIIFVFAAPSKETKLAWMREINTTLWTLLDNRRTKLEIIYPIEERINVKGVSKATSGYLYLNYDGIPGTWIRRFVVVFGSKIFLSTHEQAYCENKVETEIHTLNLEDVLFWPLPGVINFMDYEDEETKENRKHCFIVRKPKKGAKSSFTTIYFAAPDLTMLVTWVNAIRNSISAHLDEVDARNQKPKGSRSRPKIIPPSLFSPK